MRVLVVEPNPEFGGGMEGVTLRLAKELAARGHSIVLIHESDADMLPVYRSFCTTILKTELGGLRRRRPISTIKMITTLYAVIRRHSIDAVFTSHLGYIPVGAILRLMNGRRWHYHLGLPGTGSTPLKRWGTTLAGSGVCPAQHTLESWKAVGWPEATLWHVRNWVDGDEFQPADGESLRLSMGIPADAFCVGYVGRIVCEKGVEVLLKAFEGLSPQAFLVMAGRGEPQYVDKIRKLCGNPERVLMLPRTNRSQDIFAISDVVCVPSIWPEPLPLVVLEAMATATPVIVSDAGILPDLLGDEFDDLVATQGSAESLRNRISYVRDNLTALRTRAGRLRARALETFGPEQPVAEYERIIGAPIRAANAAR